MRDASNKLAAIREDPTRGEPERVVAASAGNHAQGVALAATRAEVPVTIVMLTTAPQTKIDATEGYGAEVVIEGREFQAAVEHARSLAASDDAVIVHAYDDPEIVAGQGRLGLEVAEQVPDVDTVMLPIGGGGLIGDVATALTGVLSDVRVVGV